jgi:kinesin family protein 1
LSRINYVLDFVSFSVGTQRSVRSRSLMFLGDNHVFRFNNPEEVRKQRDRATMKSNMHLSISAGDLETSADTSTRPDSPVSSTDTADVDWTYAKREAAFARLGLDPTFDNLPDEDLNKLFEKITKVKTMRDHNSKPSRPESRLSHADDIWSEPGRPPPSDTTTDDTSLQSPAMDDSLKDVQQQLEHRLEEMAESSTEAEDLKVEKEHMEYQLRLVRNQMKRLIDARARGEIDMEAVQFDPVIYSAKQLRLIRKVLDKWRAHRSFSMAETVLSNAVLIKEANIIRWVMQNCLPWSRSNSENQQQGTREGCFV